MIKTIKTFYPEETTWFSEATLISVSKGKDALYCESCPYPSKYVDLHDFLTALVLNGKPLVYKTDPECPTCAGLLATGYGIEKADDGVLSTVRAAMNNSYKDTVSAIQAIYPLLDLLSDGYYLIADADLYPADGEGNFFWNVPNELTINRATSEILVYEDDALDCLPTFLYHSQQTSTLNAKRVLHYINKQKDEGDSTRALAYYLGGFICLMLDGHHKAAAAALLKKKVSTLLIIPPSSYVMQSPKADLVKAVTFSDINIPVSDITPESETWSKSRCVFHRFNPTLKYERHVLNDTSLPIAYQNAAAIFPTVEFFAEMQNNLIEEISPEKIQQLLSNLDEYNLKMLPKMINFLALQDRTDLKEIALLCAKEDYPYSIREQAFRILARMARDPDIEYFLIDFWSEEDSPNKRSLSKISDVYWKQYPSNNID